MYQFILITALSSCVGSVYRWAPCCHPYPLPTKRYHCRRAVLAGEVCRQCRKGGWSYSLHTVYDTSIALFFTDRKYVHEFYWVCS